MYILSALPARAPTDQNLVREVYLKALEGVTRHSLEMAVENIIKGHSNLEHGFMPSPPELRRECERVMKPINDGLRYVREVEQARSEAKGRKHSSPVDATKNREILAVNIDHGTWTSTGKRTFPAGSLWEAKTGTVYSPINVAVFQPEPDDFNKIPDLPVRDTFKQVGAAG